MYSNCRFKVAIIVAALAFFSGYGHAIANTAAMIGGHNSLLRIEPAASYPIIQNIEIGLNKSTIVELPHNVRDVIVSNPKIVDAVVHTSDRVYLIGMEMGEANVFFFDSEGEQILSLEVTITRDLSVLANTLERLISGSRIAVEAVNDSVIISGIVRNPGESVLASNIAGKYLGADEKKVVNLLAVEANEQVMLKVLVAEINRDMVKQLNINLGAVAADAGNLSMAFLNVPPFGAYGAPLFGSAALDGISGHNGALRTTWGTNNNQVSNLIEAMERNGMGRLLAEPNLTAISGETATFHAGGEIPIPVSTQDEDGNSTISISWKKVGVSLEFTPHVMSEGRIGLKINTIVNEMSSENSVSSGGGTVNSLKTRNASTTVELPSGGSIAMAGMISEKTLQAVNGIPGLKDIPVLGALFRSRDFMKQETELVIIVTPYLVNPTTRSKLGRPDDGYAHPSDREGSFLGHLNKVHGIPGAGVVQEIGSAPIPTATSQPMMAPAAAMGAYAAQPMMAPAAAMGAYAAQPMMAPAAAMGAYNAQPMMAPAAAMGAYNAQPMMAVQQPFVPMTSHNIAR
jgi:pilus assembly protein CpaC